MWSQAEPSGINDSVYRLFNGLAGRSWFFDSLFSLSVENDLLKAGLIGACFFAVWFGKTSQAEAMAARKVLLTSLIAAVLVLTITKTISHMVLLPRPYVLSQKAYHLDGDELVEYGRVQYRVPAGDVNQQKYSALMNGDVSDNDLGSFPSDHAGFFVTISLGILVVSRRVGGLALGWTLFYILAAKLITGQHTITDIVAGSAVGVGVLSLLLSAVKTRMGRLLDSISSWTDRHSAISSALIFVIVFEVSSTLYHLPSILKLAVSAGKRALGVG